MSKDYKKMTAAQLVTQLNEHLDWPAVLSPATFARIEQLRRYFDSLTEKFPLTGRYWMIYLENEIRYRKFHTIDALFQRCLAKVRHIELWQCYLTYCKDRYPLPTFKLKMQQAYEFALEQIGIHYLSIPFRKDYIQFLRNTVLDGVAQYQKIPIMENVYREAVVSPMLDIENFWSEYVVFERGMNWKVAEKNIQAHSADYENAKRVAEEYARITEGLDLNFPATWSHIRTEDHRQVELWRKYIGWELSNPLGTQDQKQVVKRVVFAYEQCVLCLGYHPEIWSEFANYLEVNRELLPEKGKFLTKSGCLPDINPPTI